MPDLLNPAFNYWVIATLQPLQHTALHLGIVYR